MFLGAPRVDDLIAEVLVIAVLAPAAALEVLRAEGSPHDGACAAAA